MFTGLISELGKVSAITKGESSAIFTINAPLLINEIKLGDSVAVNGVCLTVTEFDSSGFAVDVMVQTLNLTSTGQLKAGSPVNLELATRSSDRLGGHIVQGHVDGVGKVVALSADSQWTRMDISVPSDLMKYVVAQGSICIEGVSLTVGELNDKADQVSVWLIPETLERTTIGTKSAGDVINIEVDVLAKYVERMMEKK